MATIKSNMLPVYYNSENLLGTPSNFFAVTGTQDNQVLQYVARDGNNDDALECVAYNYHIGQPIVVKTNNRLVDSRGDELNLSNYPDHKNLTGTQCYLIAPLYECCWVRPNLLGQLTSNGATPLNGGAPSSQVWVILARSKSVLSYEECYDDTGSVIGRRPVLIQYFSYEEILGGPIGAIDDPSQPDKSVSPVLKRVLSDGTTQNFTLGSSAQIWGNCYGQYSVNFFGNWVSSNNVISNVTDLQSYRTINGSYPLINTVTEANINRQLGIVIEGDDCKYTGTCKLTETEKENGGEEPTTIRCITIDSIEIARSIITGSYGIDVNGKGYPIPSSTRNGLYSIISLPNKPIDSILTEYKNQNLGISPFNRPCEKGNYTVEQKRERLRYKSVTICFKIDTSSGTVTEVSRTYGEIYDGETINVGLPIYKLSSVEYDETANCCGNLQWSTDKKQDGNEQTGSIEIKRVYLDYDYSTEISAIITDCGCEEVTIADIWCYYKNESGQIEKKFKKFSKDVSNTDTWTSPKRRVSDERCRDKKWRVYHPVDSVNDVSVSIGKDKTLGIFNGSQSLDCYLTSSVTSSTSNDYYYAVTDCPTCDRSPYFAVTYGNVNGSGSSYVLDDYRNFKYTTDSIYTQYQLMCIEPTSSNGNPRYLPKFSFVSESVSLESDDIYVINFNRKGLSNKLDPGNFQINLAYLSGSFYANNVHTGSNVKVGSSFVMSLIDDSDDYSQNYYCDGDTLTSYSIVSGTLSSGKYENASVNEYGRVYPSLGVIVLHPKRLNELLGFNTVTGSNVDGDNSFKLFTSISGAAAPTTDRTDLYKMTGRSVNHTSTYHYSIRIGKNDGNYSNNPTYVSGSYNEIFDRCLIKHPISYITTIGLYNSSYELVAVAKLSKPLKKDFDTDYLVKVRLNW